MKYFYVIANLDKDYAAETKDAILDYLTRRGASCTVQPSLPGDGGHVDRQSVPDNIQCVITIGGDGTFIRAARELAGRNIPMVGVNRGYLGFLNQVSRREDMAPVLDALLEDRYQVEERMMLMGRVFHRGKLLMEDVALNEIALTRESLLKALRFQVSVNGEFLSRYAADGILASTPTGSTAYNLSAGGPVVAPGARMIILTPICSHQMNARSIVLEHTDEIRLDLLSSGQVVAFDGDTYARLDEGDSIWIKRSPLCTRMIKLKQISFMQNLSNHLMS